MRLTSKRFIVYGDEKTLYKNARRGLVAFHTLFAFFLGCSGERYCYSYELGAYKLDGI